MNLSPGSTPAEHGGPSSCSSSPDHVVVVSDAPFRGGCMPESHDFTSPQMARGSRVHGRIWGACWTWRAECRDEGAYQMAPVGALVGPPPDAVGVEGQLQLGLAAHARDVCTCTHAQPLFNSHRALLARLDW